MNIIDIDIEKEKVMEIYIEMMNMKKKMNGYICI